MNRRDFVRFGLFLSSATVSACSVLNGSQDSAVDLYKKSNCHPLPADSELFAIDVHCHIINASDVPGGDFLKAVLHDMNGEEILSWPPVYRLLYIFVKIASLDATSADNELNHLKKPTRYFGWSIIPEKELTEENKFDELLDNVIDELEKDENRNIKEFVLDRKSLVPLQEEGLSVPDDLGSKGNRQKIKANIEDRFREAGLLAFAEVMLRNRQSNLDDLKNTYPKVNLFVPSLLDFDLWLGDDKPRSDLSDQIELMTLLMQRQQGLMHCFVPFNPWKSIIDEDYFELVTNAILSGGFIGIKLYPSMGFAPYYNVQIKINYPKSWNDTCLEDFPKKLDQQMMRLYKWCSKNNVPIMAHANPSKGPDNHSVLMGSPDNWSDAFKAMREYGFEPPPVSFGHFGGSYSHEENRPQWAEKFVDILVEEPKAFADLSYWEALLTTADKKARDETIGKLNKLVNDHPKLKQKLMYGSDWSMITQEKAWECYYNDFLNAMTETLGLEQNSPENGRKVIAQIMGQNAVNFLGLRIQAGLENNGSRLIAFYREHSIPWPTWFAMLNGSH